MPNLGQELSSLYESECNNWNGLLAELSEEIERQVVAAGIRGTVKRRIKKRESLSHKLSRAKYRPALGSEPIKDLFGLRIVVPFLEDVESVVGFLQLAFNVVEIERKSDTLSFREFAYDATHVILDLSERIKHWRLPPGVPPVCEVQVRTYLQEAWAEVEHELIYKSFGVLPDASTQKKLAALNASLLLSDTIFQELKDHQRQQATWGRQRFHELRKKAERMDSVQFGNWETPDSTPSTKSSAPRAGVSAAERSLAEGIDAHNRREYELAVERYCHALESDPSPRVRSSIHNHRGMARFMLSQVQDAIEDFGNAFDANPNNYSALNNRALAWRHLGIIEQALLDFEASLEIRSEQPEVHFLRGQTFYETDADPTCVRRELERALELQPEYPEVEDLLVKLAKKLSYSE